MLGGKLIEESYAEVEKRKTLAFPATQGWLGFTDKYWAATLVPDPATQIDAKFLADQIGSTKTYQSNYLGPTAHDRATRDRRRRSAPVRRRQGGQRSSMATTSSSSSTSFDRLIDWGWFHFITKPLFLAMDWIYRKVGNFGVAILIITVLIKIVFFPLANKSYASMAKMKAVQPEMMAIRERYGDDKMKQQQAMMELYKKEKINPVAGCLPIVIQIPVFFALYKVLFITIEMRHAPFFGWIKDLSAPDPTTVFNLFGLIPWDPTSCRGRFVPPSRRLAAHHGRDHVGPDEAQPAAARPDAGR